MKKLHQEIISFVVGGVIGITALGAGVYYWSQDRVLPGVMVAEVEVGGMRREEVVKKLDEATHDYSPTLSYGEADLDVPKILFKFETSKTATKAMGVGRSSLIEIWRLLHGKKEIELDVAIEEVEWERYLEELRGVVEIAGMPNELKLVNGQVEIVNGEDGIVIEERLLREDLLQVTSRLIEEPLRLKVRENRQTMNEEELAHLQERASQLVNDSLVLLINEERATLSDVELISLLSTEIDTLGMVSSEKLASYITGLSERYNTEPQDAILQFTDGNVSEFAPALDGIKINTHEAERMMQDGIEELMMEGVNEAEVEISIERTAPKITTEEVNDLGIVERIGKGESYYAHSIPNRVYNVGLASSRVSGALVPPGEEFSFNTQVGEISGATGYKTAYVISGGRTILGDGGGVCQVSTTVFRAALNAGLPITERFAHAYRVGYYEQNAKAGFDATIYSPSKDFKFLNDTPGHILVQAIVDEPNRHLIIEFYGTKDGRVALVSPARVWDVSPPPPDLYQDDPSLPVGEVKQVDWAAWGAKAAFDYRVERAGETIFSKTFNSNFQPWQNVYLRGTAE